MDADNILALVEVLTEERAKRKDAQFWIAHYRGKCEAYEERIKELEASKSDQEASNE